MTITIISGPMASGKSKHALKIAETHAPSSVFKSERSYARDGGFIKSRYYKSKDALTGQPYVGNNEYPLPANSVYDYDLTLLIREEAKAGCQVLIIDEAHLLAEPCWANNSEEFLKINKLGGGAIDGLKVYIYGLDKFADGKPSWLASSLCCDHIHLTGECAMCACPATHTHRITIDNPITDEYEALCAHCWEELNRDRIVSDFVNLRPVFD